MSIRGHAALLSLATAVVLLGSPHPAAAQSGVVRAVLFYSPTCPHCHRVIGEDLPRIFAEFGGPALMWEGTAGHVVGNGTVELLLVDVTFPLGLAAYRAADAAFTIPPERMGVPRLVCGDSVFVGDVEIPERLPGLIRAGLARGGTDWPAIEGLSDLFPPAYVASSRSAADTTGGADTGPGRRADTTVPATEPQRPADTAITAETRRPDRAGAGGLVDRRPADATGTTVPEPAVGTIGGDTGTVTAPIPPHIPGGARQGSVIARTFQGDPVGTSLAILLILVMVFSLGWAFLHRPTGLARLPPQTVPLLVLVGVGIAAYLAYVEMTGARAVCGPVGDCNAVQQSRYATVFGIPVALFGVGGYATILGAWTWARRSRDGTRERARRALLAFTAIGVLGSLVLTILEPFVIGAVCAWCLGSAAIMTGLLWAAATDRAMALPRPTAGEPGTELRLE